MKRFLKRMKFLMNFRKSFPFLVDFFRSGEVSLVKKILAVGLVGFYIWLPLDLIPDVFLFFGIVDDLAVFTFILQLMVKMAPLELQNKYGLTKFK
ncbi:DUF1232 domain-containing protein (plasmid) [Cytobacillus spongiae]|nr:DUF1232 domain-containing protein [Cytobacillus spongiae]UII58509.1 DUF1232 domain-containing protein [Cytobacillus spongiae]